MLIKTRGIVLKTKKYSETSVIVDVFTEAKGLRSYIIGGVRQPKARVSAGLLQVMSLVDIVAYHREDKELTRLKEVKAFYAYRSIPFDIRKGAVGLFLIEVARSTIQGHEEHPALFGFLADNLVFLDETAVFSNLHLYFLLALSWHLGFFPGGEFCGATPVFDMQEGLFIAGQPAHPYWLPERMSQLLCQLRDVSKEQNGEVKMSREERRQLLRHLLDYYRLHIGGFPEIHSHQVLEEVLA
ncbi:MAG: DNA repair protein RecO [Saprospiraceae bacterium]|nr:MAG: DNA repair protein RecO [Saprospiraceae bacterium]